MGEVRRTIKRNAKWALRGGWGRAAAMLLIAMAIGVVLGLLEGGVQSALGLSAYLDKAGTPGYFLDDVLNTTWAYLAFSAGMGLLSLLFAAPLEIGVLDWYVGRTSGQDQGVSEIFWPYGSKTFFSAVWLHILIYLGSVFWFVLLTALPAGAACWAAYAFQSLTLAPSVEALCLVGVVAGLLLTAAAVVAWLAVTTRYTLAPYLLTRRYAKGPWQALRLSVRATKGHRWETFVLGLSFLPWLLLCVFFFPVFYVGPYMRMSFTLYARYLIESGGVEAGDDATREFTPHTEA